MVSFAVGHRAACLSELMVQLNLATSFEEHCAARDAARELGLYLTPGFYANAGWVSPETIALIKTAPDMQALNDFLRELNRKGLKL